MKKLLCGICLALILAVVTAYGLRRASAVSRIVPSGGNTSFALIDQVFGVRGQVAALQNGRVV